MQAPAVDFFFERIQAAERESSHSLQLLVGRPRDVKTCVAMPIVFCRSEHVPKFSNDHSDMEGWLE